MQTRLLEKLACPKCHGELSCSITTTADDGEVEAGSLSCGQCQQTYPITKGIPRFVPEENYATSFGYQWNRFRLEQIDSNNGTRLSTDRLHGETGWTSEWMKDKWILDAGCGAGRFLDVAVRSGGEVVGLDISSAIDAAKANLGDRKNVHFVQASIFEPPFRTGAFDGCYCIGVIQHTPDPQKAMRALPRTLRSDGQIAITAYERKPWTPLYSKYLVRPITRRLKKTTLLAIIKGVMPVLFPITNVLFKLPVLGGVFRFTIPIANYANERSLSRQQRYDWAILDTFDMLSPQYDQPQTQLEVVHALSSEGIVDLKRIPNAGLNVVGRKG
ncbi:MAG: hypothetical protein QOJ64_4061 [Acidobacteriota bacterium]|jgi:2-polyprenyl-3-methyl-5-hydroxy-6-metoxy-1,4-benzoquinol methylase/uncharacterized protein YbaR (Trm112 family)|nr:hypothetical protein [Acidobacteriota bacterium]